MTGCATLGAWSQYRASFLTYSYCEIGPVVKRTIVVLAALPIEPIFTSLGAGAFGCVLASKLRPIQLYLWEESTVYASITTWTFKPGTEGPKIRASVKALEPSLRQIEGLQHYYWLRTGDDTYVSVLLYDTQPHAEAGFAILAPAARQQLGNIIENMGRQSGEVEAELDLT